MPVADRQRFDEAALERYLRAHVAGLHGPARGRAVPRRPVEPDLPPTAGDGAQYVLRRKPAGPLLPSAHAVDREFRVIARAARARASRWPTRCACARTTSVIGTMFYVMSYVAGRNFWDPRCRV